VPRPGLGALRGAVLERERMVRGRVDTFHEALIYMWWEVCRRMQQQEGGGWESMVRGLAAEAAARQIGPGGQLQQGGHTSRSSAAAACRCLV
jgi:hypothetical protein